MTHELPPIIGICGDIGAGKTTAAKALTELGYVRASFASPVKELVLELFPIPPSAVYGTQGEKKAKFLMNDGATITGRDAMEKIGDAARDVWPGVWVDQAMRRVKATRGARIVFDDVRRTNEITAIKEAGGVIWRVGRVGGPSERTGHPSDEEWRNHPADAILVAHDGDVQALGKIAQKAAQEGGILSDLDLFGGEPA